MKRNAVLLVTIIALAGVLAVTGCSSSSKSKATTSTSSAASGTQSSAAEEPTLGSTFDFDDLSIKLGDSFTTTTLSNEFSDHNGQTVIALPVSVTNNSSESKGLNMFYVKEFGAQGTELENCYTYFDDDVRMAGEARPGATLNGNLYFYYDGNGDYYLTFDKFTEKVEVKIPINI